MYMTVMISEKKDYINAREHINIFDGDEMHGILLGCVGESRTNASLLYRVAETHDVIFLYIQSEEMFPPDSLSRYGFTLISIIDVEMQLNGLSEEDEFRFNILTVPTKAVFGTKKRTYLTSDSEIKDWFSGKALRSGFLSDNDMFRIEMKSVIRFSRRQENSENGEKKIKTKTVTAPCAMISGHGIVKDRVKFEKTVRGGFGKMKNFGAGLLLVK